MIFSPASRTDWISEYHPAQPPTFSTESVRIGRTGHLLPWPLYLQHRPRLQPAMATVQGHFLPHALAAKSASHIAVGPGVGVTHLNNPS